MARLFERWDRDILSTQVESDAMVVLPGAYVTEHVELAHARVCKDEERRGQPI